MNRRGFTLIELLVAASMLSVVLGVLIGYFVQQANMTQVIQARNEVQDKTRMVMQLVTQDLQMAGSKRYVNSAGNVSDAVLIPSCALVTCLVTGSAAGGEVWRDGVSVQYITSLRPEGEACRRVGYRFQGDAGTLQRSDVACGAAEDAFVALADNILALDIRYVCSNGSVVDSVPDASSCPGGSAYARTARVSVVGRSNNPLRNQAAAVYAMVGGSSVPCPAGFFCYALTQEVEMPNLKDQ